jgi:hypothetical protein
VDVLTLVLVVLVAIFLLGGFAWPRPVDGGAPVSVALYVLAVVVLVLVLVRLLGAV